MGFGPTVALWFSAALSPRSALRQPCLSGAWGSGPWNAGAGEKAQPSSGSLTQRQYNVLLRLTALPWWLPRAVAPPWTCKETEELPGHLKSYSPASSGPLPPSFIWVVGNSDWATPQRCRVPPPGILSPYSTTQLCEQKISHQSLFADG